MAGGGSGGIPVQRRARLVAVLRGKGVASISELALETGASESTVRRDLEELAGRSEVRRTRGGAVFTGGTIGGTTFEPLFAERSRQNISEKERIGRYAIGLAKRGQGVLFDSSSTVMGAVRALVESPVRMTAVTNDVSLAASLGSVRGVKVVVPGGELREGSFTLLGPATRGFLSRLHVDVAFIGIHAITGDRMSEAGLEVAEVKRAMIRAAGRVVLLADHSKFSPPAFFEVAGLEEVDDLVTGDETPQEAIEAAREVPVRVHLV